MLFVLQNCLPVTLSHPEALHWRVKSSGVRHSKIRKGTVLVSLGEERLKPTVNNDSKWKLKGSNRHPIHLNLDPLFMYVGNLRKISCLKIITNNLFKQLYSLLAILFFLQDILGYFDLFYFSPFQLIGDCLRFHSHNSTTPVSPYFIITVVVVCLYSFNKIIQRMLVLWLHSGDAKCSGRLLMYNFAKPKQSIKTKKSRLKKLTSSASILKLHPYHT